jgi:hypothetical protein
MTVRVLRLAVGALLAAGSLADAQINMPDPSLIAGKAIPASELPTGTVTVRVVREAIGNNITGQDVRVTIAGAPRTAKTDAEGRAEFASLPPGAQGRAEATVDGEALVSDPFTVPSSGGLRVILVAGLAQAAERRAKEAAAAAAAPPIRGAVAFGDETRIVMEFQDDVLRVFYILQVSNTARAPVDIGGPLIIDLPSGAAGASLLEGSTPSASVSGDRVTVTGPFAPGITNVQVGFELRSNSPELTVTQRWPIALDRVTVAAEKAGALALSSSQFTSTSDVRPGDDGVYVMGTGPGLPAGGVLTMQLSNLPVASRLPSFVALGLAGIIVAVGVWLSMSAGATEQMARTRLMARRDTLLGELAKLERRRRTRGGELEDSRDAGRRQQLLSELERIYGELDQASGGPQGGGEGIAA